MFVSATVLWVFSRLNERIEIAIFFKNIVNKLLSAPSFGSFFISNLETFIHDRLPHWQVMKFFLKEMIKRSLCNVHVVYCPWNLKSQGGLDKGIWDTFRFDFWAIALPFEKNWYYTKNRILSDALLWQYQNTLKN